jgi:hypothetical protein
VVRPPYPCLGQRIRGHRIGALVVLIVVGVVNHFALSSLCVNSRLRDDEASISESKDSLVRKGIKFDCTNFVGVVHACRLEVVPGFYTDV